MFLDPKTFVRYDDDKPNLLEQLSARLKQKTTPDFIERKQEGQIPVFVYGTLRKGFHNHGLIKGLPYLGEAYTTIEKYEMLSSPYGDFPLVFEREPKIKGKKKNHAVGKIRGEVYVIDPLTLLELDRLENNGGMYKRERQWVFLANQSARPGASIRPSISCWMYLSNPSWWNTRSGYCEPVKGEFRNGCKFYDWSDSFEDDGGTFMDVSRSYMVQ